MSTSYEPKQKIGESAFPKRLVVTSLPKMLREDRADQLLLVIGPRSIQRMMMKVIAGLADEEQVRVLDAGNQFDAYGWRVL